MEDIHARKELEVGQKILDYMGSTELIFILMMLCVGNHYHPSNGWFARGYKPLLLASV